MKYSKLSSRQGKCLRFIVDRVNHTGKGVRPKECVNKIEWSDLPHSIVSATQTFSQLKSFGLVVRNGRGEYSPTMDGIKLIERANRAEAWNE